MTELRLKQTMRDGTADLLKGFAVLFMIQVHLMEQFASADTFNSLIGNISMFLGGPLCAPVFLAVMGYFLLSPGKTLKYFLKRGTILFFGGILLNTARSANLLVQIWRGEMNLNPWHFIFGADILTLAGLSLILTGFLRMVLKDRRWLYFILALVVAAIAPLLNQFASSEGIPAYINAFFFGTAEWSYFPLFPWFSYVLAGYGFRLFLQKSPLAAKIDLQNQYLYFVPLWIGILISITWAARITFNLAGADGYYHHGIIFFGWVILFMISYLVLVRLVEIHYGDRAILRVIKWIGGRVTSLYVIQWLIIGNLATLLFRSQNLFQFFAWFVIVTLTTVLAGKLYEKIGEKNKKRGPSLN